MTNCILCLTIAILVLQYIAGLIVTMYFSVNTYENKYAPCLLYSDTAISLHDIDNVGPQKDNDKTSPLYLTKRIGL
jgi:hypothetical protein